MSLYKWNVLERDSKQNDMVLTSCVLEQAKVTNVNTLFQELPQAGWGYEAIFLQSIHAFR